jgi:MFS transporter, AAHS family, 4-hydroxybenzoate transporter
VFSAALIGGIVGMLVGGPMADKFGRRPTLISQIFLFGAFTLLSAFARDAFELLFYRFFAGVELGLALTVSYVVVVEYAPGRYRILCVTLIYAGYSTGAGLGGLLARSLLQSYSWHAIFFVGAAAAIVLALIFSAMLPETLEFLVGANRSREHIDRLARQMRPNVFRGGRADLLCDTFGGTRQLPRQGNCLARSGWEKRCFCG